MFLKNHLEGDRPRSSAAALAIAGPRESCLWQTKKSERGGRCSVLAWCCRAVSRQQRCAESTCAQTGTPALPASTFLVSTVSMLCVCEYHFCNQRNMEPRMYHLGYIVCILTHCTARTRRSLSGSPLPSPPLSTAKTIVS